MTGKTASCSACGHIYPAPSDQWALCPRCGHMEEYTAAKPIPSISGAEHIPERKRAMTIRGIGDGATPSRKEEQDPANALGKLSLRKMATGGVIEKIRPATSDERTLRDPNKGSPLLGTTSDIDGDWNLEEATAPTARKNDEAALNSHYSELPDLPPRKVKNPTPLQGQPTADVAFSPNDTTYTEDKGVEPVKTGIGLLMTKTNAPPIYGNTTSLEEFKDPSATDIPLGIESGDQALRISLSDNIGDQVIEDLDEAAIQAASSAERALGVSAPYGSNLGGPVIPSLVPSEAIPPQHQASTQYSDFEEDGPLAVTNKESDIKPGAILDSQTEPATGEIENHEGGIDFSTTAGTQDRYDAPPLPAPPVIPPRSTQWNPPPVKGQAPAQYSNQSPLDPPPPSSGTQQLPALGELPIPPINIKKNPDKAAPLSLEPSIADAITNELAEKSIPKASNKKSKNDPIVVYVPSAPITDGSQPEMPMSSDGKKIAPRQIQQTPVLAPIHRPIQPRRPASGHGIANRSPVEVAPFNLKLALLISIPLLLLAATAIALFAIYS